MFGYLKKIEYDTKLIEALFKAKAGFVGSNLLAPLFLFFLLKDFVPLRILAVWMLLQMIVFLLRYSVSSRGLQALQSNKEEANRYLKQYLLLIFLNAFLLGISSLFVVFYLDITYSLFLLLIILTVLIASLITLSSVFHAVFIFITTTLVVFIGGLFFAHLSHIYLLMIIALVIYLVMLVVLSFRMHKTSVQNLQDIDNFKNLIDSALEAIVVSDENKNIVQTNSVAISMFGFKNLEDALGVNLSRFLPNDTEALKIQQALSQSIATPYEVNLLKIDGTPFPVLAGGRDIEREKKKYRLTTLIDLTELKEKELQVLQQSRLAQLGEMVSMIAHQWKQPLSAIAATTASMEMKFQLKTFDTTTKSGREAQEMYLRKELKYINNLIKTLSLTINDFRNFYKPSKKKEYRSLDTIVKKALDIIGPSLSNNKIVVEYTAHDVDLVEMYKNEIVQVVLSVFQNSLENFKEQTIEKPCICITIEANRVSICDNGGGIDEEIVQQIFNPYFSTKEKKNGTGLGLYMAKKIVEQHHNGTLNMHNKNGGACFELSL